MITREGHQSRTLHPQLETNEATSPTPPNSTSAEEEACTNDIKASENSESFHEPPQNGPDTAQASSEDTLSHLMQMKKGPSTLFHDGYQGDGNLLDNEDDSDPGEYTIEDDINPLGIDNDDEDDDPDGYTIEDDINPLGDRDDDEDDDPDGYTIEDDLNPLGDRDDDEDDDPDGYTIEDDYQYY